jgi:hypothetical protein
MVVDVEPGRRHSIFYTNLPAKFGGAPPALGFLPRLKTTF